MSRIRICIFAFFAVFILITSCKKDDCRDKYTGNWNFVVQVAKLNVDSIPQYVRDTIAYAGLIGKANSTDEINIHYLEDFSMILKVNETGELSGFLTPSTGVSGSGDFEDNFKIHLHFKWGGQGGFLEHTVDGIKK